MNKKKRIILIAVMAVITTFFTCACATADEIYSSITSFEATDEELKLLTEGKLGMNLEGGATEDGIDLSGNGIKGMGYAALSHVCAGAKEYALYIIPGSLIIGFIMMRLAPKAIGIRKTALFVFIIGIPVCTLLVIYGSAFLADAFNK